MTEMWTRPMAEVQQFAANEYVAACGMKDGKYIFTCDAPAGTMYVKYNGSNYRVGNYHPCEKKHVTDGPAGYYDGWIDRNGNRRQDEDEPDVLLWLEGFRYDSFWHDVSVSNGHASASLTREQIQEERS